MQTDELLDSDDCEEIYFLSPDSEYLCDTDQNVEIEVQFVESDPDSHNGQESRKSNFRNSKEKRKLGRKTKYGMTRGARKLMYNTNKPYINTKGKEIEPRSFDEKFKCSCKKNCTEVVKLEDRKRLFDEFWSIGSFSSRCLVLQQHIKEFPKKRTYTKNASRRQFSRKYYISNTEICKVAFLKTLQIHSNRVDVALQKRHDDEIVDRRGSKSGGWNKCSEEQTESVMRHINKFLMYIACCRVKQVQTRQFEGSKLNLKKMYDEYVQSCRGVTPVSHSTYKMIFYRNFNRRVKSPRKLLGKSQILSEPSDWHEVCCVGCHIVSVHTITVTTLSLQLAICYRNLVQPVHVYKIFQ